MSTTVAGTDRKLQASAGMSGQLEMLRPQEAQAKAQQVLPLQAMTGASFSGVLGFALIHSGKEQQDVAAEIFVSVGYFSRFMSSLAEAWAKRVIRFCRATDSLAPIQWIADQLGCDIVVRASVEAELAAARAKVADMERRYGRAVA